MAGKVIREKFPGGGSASNLEIAQAFLPFISPADRTAAENSGWEQYILERLGSSPVPLPLLVNLGRRTAFAGLPLLDCALGKNSPDSPSLFDREGKFAISPPPTSSAGDGLTIDSACRMLFSTLGERREGQLEMARVVGEALRRDRVALVEAGTGTGKSLAYLLPAVLYSRETGERIIISTHTKNLQDQLYLKELPLLKRILKIDIAAERLLGRENYLCGAKVISRVVRLSRENPREALSLALGAALPRMRTAEAMASVCGWENHRRLEAPPRCLMNACAHASRCPLIISRKKAREANIVFVNHALLITDYAQGGSILGPYRGVIFDEAHHIEHCVMENLSVKSSPGDLDYLWQQVLPVSTGNEKWKFFIHELSLSDSSVNWPEAIDGLALSLEELRRRCSQFFQSISFHLNPRSELRNIRTRYHDGQETFADLSDELGHYLLQISNLRQLLKPMVEVKTGSAGGGLQLELEYIHAELEGLADALSYLCGPGDENSVFWVGWKADGAVENICGSPLEVDRRFADFIVDSCSAAVFTSATLVQDGNFNYLKERLGIRFITPEPLELVAQSPFRFEDNCLILLREDLGDPHEREFSTRVGETVIRLARELERSLMVLFTSYRLCADTAEFLESKALPGPLLVQGRGESREVLAARLRGSSGGVLCGVASFWEGVDFPGEQLEILVIPKLPFPVPTEPIVEARSDKLRREGENPFLRLHLPEAVLRLRQGVGRLIRRTGDKGVVVLLDSRLASRPYGRSILESLPVPAQPVSSLDEVVARASAWFEKKRTEGPSGAGDN
ncbi:MAG: DEAD/DEAH box helicase [Candidatus Krumholzibacteriota bacterium]|nr:DEAD/DEAH box helicase [Candidatus Krumholzibacteriota bacterium]